MTPRVTYDGDIILELTLENSARGQDSNIAGQNLPSFFSRKVTTKLRLRDGESNLLAGLLREDERKSLKGFPRRYAAADREAVVFGQRSEHQADRHRDAADAAHHPHARFARAGSQPDLHRHAEQHGADGPAGDDWRRRNSPEAQPQAGAAPGSASARDGWQADRTRSDAAAGSAGIADGQLAASGRSARQLADPRDGSRAARHPTQPSSNVTVFTPPEAPPAPVPPVQPEPARCRLRRTRPSRERRAQPPARRSPARIMLNPPTRNARRQRSLYRADLDCRRVARLDADPVDHLQPGAGSGAQRAGRDVHAPERSDPGLQQPDRRQERAHRHRHHAGPATRPAHRRPGWPGWSRRCSSSRLPPARRRLGYRDRPRSLEASAAALQFLPAGITVR